MIKRLIEAALFMSNSPLSIEELARICSTGDFGLIRRAIEELQMEYSKRNSALEILKIGNGYKMKVVSELEQNVANLASLPEISPSILKTLALIAYSQPITQSRIAKQRGSKVYKHIKTLLKEEFISAEKYKRSKLLRTTQKFKEYFQIEDLSELKKIEAKLDKFNGKVKKQNNIL
ncbi:MAG: SMC-Scp complex subunit ScpB [Candidatus Altiarchaeota archaeon]